MRIAGPAVAALLLGACAEGEVETPPDVYGGLRLEENVMRYAGADKDGATFRMREGDVLRVELETIPTAGYVWQVTAQPGFLALTGEQTRPTDPQVQNQPGFTGGNHFMAFDFTATEPGAGTLELTEGRPWELEAGEPPEGVFSLTITVTEQDHAMTIAD